MNPLVSRLVTAGGLALFASTAICQDVDDDDYDFHAFLSGAQEVVPPDSPTTPSPGVDTPAQGRVDVTFARDLSSFNFRLAVQNGVGVTQAHLHCGLAGQNGPIVVFLSALNEQGQDVNDVLAEGTRSNGDIVAGAADCEALIGRPIRNIAALASAAADGLVYANVHTLANPAGEVRGQLVPGDADDDGGLGDGGAPDDDDVGGGVLYDRSR